MHPSEPVSRLSRLVFTRFGRRLVRVIGLLLMLALLAAACSAPSDSSTTTTTAPSETAPPTPTSSPTPTPSLTPTPSPTPTPPITEPDRLAIDLPDLPGYMAGEQNSDGSQTKVFADDRSIRWWILKGDKVVGNYTPEDTIAFGDPETFTDVEGVLTFRGNHYRNRPAWGTADVNEKKLEIIWTHNIGSVSGHNSWWPGAGWTGQPLLVHWPEETRQIMGLNESAKAKDLVEVIYPVFDGKIYFLDLETGKRTRDPIHVGFSFKGTASADPRGYPLLYAGQGLREANGRKGTFYFHIFDLIQNKRIYGIPGIEPLSFRTWWGAFDSSALINWQTDTLFEGGENGLFYKVKLHTVYDPEAGTVAIDPEILRLRFRTPINKEYGIENSTVAYRNLGFFADNDGALVCLDLTTLEPIWTYHTGDDHDSTLVLEETEDGVFLYSANTLDKRGKLPGTANDICNMRKFDALSGQMLWQYDVPVLYDSVLNSGSLATPLLGSDDFADLVIFNISKTTSYTAGLLLALDKDTGRPVWERPLDAHSWSSPIAIKGQDGKSYGVFADSAGNLHLFDPRTGEDYTTLFIGGNCEASPSAYNDVIVVATYAAKIYGIKVS